jgi:ATP/maltotriose-dependent transcriptional regulator MalT
MAAGYQHRSVISAVLSLWWPGSSSSVLGLVVEGFFNRAIATRLFVVERTVEAHVTSIVLKLGLTDSGDHQ